MLEPEDEPVYDAADIPEWAYLTTLEFLDGPRRMKNHSEGLGIHFSRKGSPLVLLAPSRAYLEEKAMNERSGTLSDITKTEEEDEKNLREFDQLNSKMWEEYLSKSVLEQKEYQNRKLMWNRYLRQVERGKVLYNPPRVLSDEGALWAEEMNTEWQTRNLEDYPRGSTVDEDALVKELQRLSDSERWVQAIPSLRADMEQEDEDLSDTIFTYGRNCGLSTSDLGLIHEEMIDAVNAYDPTTRADPLDLLVRDINFPYNRLRLRLNQSVASEFGDQLFDYEGGDVRVHNNLNQGSLFFIPVFFDEGLFGSDPVIEKTVESTTSEEESSTTSKKKSSTTSKKKSSTTSKKKSSPEESSYTIKKLDVKRVWKYLFKIQSAENNGETLRRVPLMTLQMCMFLKNELQQFASTDYDRTEVLGQSLDEDSLRDYPGYSSGFNNDDFLKRLSLLMVGGDRLQEVYDKASDKSAKETVVHRGASRLVFLPVFTGRKWSVIDASSETSLHRFSKMVHGSNRPPGITSSMATARVLESFTVDEIDNGGTETLKQAITTFIDASTASTNMEIEGLGYDGTMVRHPIMGTVVLVHPRALMSSVVPDVHVRHIDFYQNEEDMGASRFIPPKMKDTTGIETFYHKEKGKSGKVKRKKDKNGKDIGKNRVFLCQNEFPTIVLMSSTITMPTPILDELLSQSSSRETRIHRPDEKFTFWEGTNSPITRASLGDILGINDYTAKTGFIWLAKREYIRKHMYNNVELISLLPEDIEGLKASVYLDVIQRIQGITLGFAGELGRREKARMKVILPSSLVARREEEGSSTQISKYQNILSLDKGGDSFMTFRPESLDDPWESSSFLSIYRMILREFLHNAYHKNIRIGNNPNSEVRYPPLVAINDGFPFAIQRGAASSVEELDGEEMAIYTPIRFSVFLKQTRPSLLKKFIKKGSEEAESTIQWFRRANAQVRRTLRDSSSPGTVLQVMAAQSALLDVWFAYADALDAVGHEYKPIGLEARGVGAWGVLSSFAPLYSHSMGDLGENFTQTIETFPIQALLDRFYQREYMRKRSRNGEPVFSDVRKAHLGEVDRLFSKYQSAYTQLLSGYWALNEGLSDSQSDQSESYMLSDQRMWYLNEVAQLSRLIVATITYFSFRRYALFGDYFAMYRHYDGLVSGFISPTNEPKHFSDLDGNKIREKERRITRRYRRNLYSDDERTDEENEILSVLSYMDEWTETTEHKQRLYLMGAFDTDTLPSWESVFEEDEPRLFLRPIDDEKKRTLIWRDELKRYTKLKRYTSRKPKDKTEDKTEEIQYAQILTKKKGMKDDIARMVFPSWWNQSFQHVRFSSDFTLEDFDPSVYGNLISFLMLRKLEKQEALGEAQSKMLRDWTCRRSTIQQDPALRIRHSGDHMKGNGIFCDDPRGIPPGTFIMPFDGLIVRHSQLFGSEEERVDGKIYDSSDVAYFGTDATTGEAIYIAPGYANDDVGDNDPSKKYHMSRFFNGAVSRKIANCAIVKWIVNGKLRLWIVNVYSRTIQPGEELLWTYDISGIEFFKQIGLYSQSAGFIYPPSALYDYKGNQQLSIETDDPKNVIHDPAMKFLDKRRNPLEQVRSAMFKRGVTAEGETAELGDDDDDDEEEGAEEVPQEEAEREENEALEKERIAEERIMAQRSVEETKLSVKDRLEGYDLKHEEDMRRYLLIHKLYSGVPKIPEKLSGAFESLGVVDVPSLDFFRLPQKDHALSKENGFTNNRRNIRRASSDFPEIHQPLPYLTYRNRETWKIQARLRKDTSFDPKVRTSFQAAREHQAKLEYYGIPTPRRASRFSFVAPIFKKLAYRYGSESIMSLTPRFQVEDYANVQHRHYMDDAMAKITDTALSVDVRRRSVVNNVGLVVEEAEAIRNAFFSARRKAQYGIIQKVVNRLKVVRDEETKKSTISRIAIELDYTKNLATAPTNRGGDPDKEQDSNIKETEQYKELYYGLEYSRKAQRVIDRAWKQNAGYDLYSNASVIASNYDNVYTEFLEIPVKGGGTRRKMHEDFIVLGNHSNMAKNARKKMESLSRGDDGGSILTAVRYSGNANKGLGLYARKTILPGQPIIPFLGEIITKDEYHDRTVKYVQKHEEWYKAYLDQVQRKIRSQKKGKKDLTDEDINKIKQEVGLVLSEDQGIVHPDPGYYSAEYIQIGDISLMLDPTKKGNDARFANTSRLYNNCTLQFVLVKNEDDATRENKPYELVPWLINTFDRPIYKNQEILWNYTGHEILDFTEEAPSFVDVDNHQVSQRKKAHITMFPYVPPEQTTEEGKKEAEFGTPLVPVDKFPNRVDRDFDPRSISEEEEKNLFFKLFGRSGPEFAYGKEMVHRDWTQYSFVLRPNTVEAFDVFSEQLPATGMDIVRSMLSVQDNTVLGDMSPLALKSGDILHPIRSRDVNEAGLKVRKMVQDTQVLSNDILMAWCNGCAFMHQLPLRHFENTIVRNKWLDIERGGKKRSEGERAHTLAQELTMLDSSGDPVSISNAKKNAKRDLAMMLAFATLAIDNLQHRIFGVLPQVARSPPKKENYSFQADMANRNILPSQEQRNLLFLWMTYWRRTTVLFTNDREDTPLQIIRLLTLLRALGFTYLGFYSIHAGTTTSVTKYLRVSTDLPEGIDSLEFEKVERGELIYEHQLDDMMKDASVVRNKDIRDLYQTPTIGSIIDEGPEVVVRGKKPKPTDETQRERRELKKYPLIPDLQYYIGNIEGLERVAHRVNTLGPPESWTAPLPDESWAINIRKHPHLKPLIQAINKNFDHARQGIQALKNYNPFSVNPSTFPVARSYVEAHYDVAIIHNLERLNALFRLIRNSLNKQGVTDANEHESLRLVTHGLRAVEILANEIKSYPKFQEWKAVRGPYLYRKEARRERVVEHEIPTMALNFDIIDAQNSQTIGRGPSAYYLLASYAMSMYERMPSKAMTVFKTSLDTIRYVFPNSLEEWNKMEINPQSEKGRELINLRDRAIKTIGILIDRQSSIRLIDEDFDREDQDNVITKIVIGLERMLRMEKDRELPKGTNQIVEYATIWPICSVAMLAGMVAGSQTSLYFKAFRTEFPELWRCIKLMRDELILIVLDTLYPEDERRLPTNDMVKSTMERTVEMLETRATEGIGDDDKDIIEIMEDALGISLTKAESVQGPLDDLISSYDDIFNFGNELEQGPFLFRGTNRKDPKTERNISIGWPWWSDPNDPSELPFEPEEEEEEASTEEQPSTVEEVHPTRPKPATQGPRRRITPQLVQPEGQEEQGQEGEATTEGEAPTEEASTVEEEEPTTEEEEVEHEGEVKANWGSVPIKPWMERISLIPDRKFIASIKRLLTLRDDLVRMMAYQRKQIEFSTKFGFAEEYANILMGTIDRASKKTKLEVSDDDREDMKENPEVASDAFILEGFIETFEDINVNLMNLREAEDGEQADIYGEAINKLTKIMNNDWNEKKDILPRKMEAFKTSLKEFNNERIENRKFFFQLLKDFNVELKTIEKAIKEAGQFEDYSILITAPYKRKPLYLRKRKDEETPNVPEGGILGLIQDEELV